MRTGRNGIYLRNLWLWTCGLPEHPLPEDPLPPALPNIEEIMKRQWCKGFILLCRNRLLMGTFRYGFFSKGKGEYDNIASAIERLQEYQKGGNKEHLLDAANLCHVEWVEEVNQKAHFTSIDDGKHKELING